MLRFQFGDTPAKLGTQCVELGILRGIKHAQLSISLLALGFALESKYLAKAAEDTGLQFFTKGGVLGASFAHGCAKGAV